MKKKFLPSLLILFVGSCLFIFGSIWANQTGYDHPDPLKRDANIGAGLIALAGLAIGFMGLVWLIATLIKNHKASSNR